jgi:hypothetical protein
MACHPHHADGGAADLKTVRGDEQPPDVDARQRRSARATARTMGAIAALVYLSFFTTYRYGRPHLTSAPEIRLFGVFCPGLVAHSLLVNC